jgi:hypothetical protein
VKTARAQEIIWQKGYGGEIEWSTSAYFLRRGGGFSEKETDKAK